MHADRAVHRIVEHENDRAGPFEHRCRQLLSSHHKPAIAAKADDQTIGMDELGGDRRGNAVAHGAAGRPELASWSAILQKAVRPAAEIAGVARYDRIVWEPIAQPSHDRAEIERTSGRGRDEPSLVFRARRFAPARPASRCRRRQRCGSGGEFRHAGLDRESGTEYAAQLLGGGMHVDQPFAWLRYPEQRIGLRGDLADPRADREQQIGLLDPCHES